MDKDYLIIAVNPDQQYAIRLACLNHAVKEELGLHNPPAKLQKVFSDFLLASVLLGSRQDDQQTLLYKLRLGGDALVQFNCEVSSNGVFRAALFERSAAYTQTVNELRVTTLTRGNQVYESVLEVIENDIEKTYRAYLEKSIQSHSVFYVLSDFESKKYYGLWIEKLPSTPLTIWENIIKEWDNPHTLASAVTNTDDPDMIVRNLFKEPIQILVVTKPRIVCACNKERILDALAVRSPEDLTGIFMENNGVESVCDYCKKIWQVTDEEVKQLLKTTATVQ